METQVAKKRNIKDVARDNGIDVELLALESFNKRLNTPPPKEEIQENRDKSKYLPISFVQMTLDEMYFGLWETVGYEEKIIVNELVGKVELRVFHPVIKQWITKTGVAANPIRLKSGSAVTDVESKIYNALSQDAPHLLSDCIKNAAKQLGKRFGRDLNRKFEDNYNAAVTQATTSLLLAEMAEIQCAGCNTMPELVELFNNNPSWHGDQKVMDVFNIRKNEIKSKKEVAA